MNIVGYAAERKNGSAACALDSVDALILCWLAYFCYPEYVRGDGATLGEMKSMGLLPEDEMFGAAYRVRASKKLFSNLADNPRFSGIRLSDYVQISDEKQWEQFAAVTARLADGSCFVAFRGTDPSFVGWKESFSLAYRFPLPSQRDAAEYLAAQMKKSGGAKFFVGGHSKGGNLAIYAAANADDDLKGRICRVYCFDGPDFPQGTLCGRELEKIADRVVKIVPKSSFVGMLFGDGRQARVVDSGAASVLQHDPFTWKIKAGDFVYKSRMTRSSQRLAMGVNAWICSIEVPDRQRFVSLVCGALDGLDTSDFNVFFRTLHRQIPALYRQYKRLNADDRAFVARHFRSLRRLVLSGGKERGKGQKD